MYACMYVMYLSLFVHACVHACPCLLMGIYDIIEYTCTLTHIHIHVHVHVHIHLHTHIYIYIYTTYIYILISLSICGSWHVQEDVARLTSYGRRSYCCNSGLPGQATSLQRASPQLSMVSL